MTDISVTQTDEKKAERRAFTNGLRQLADFLDAHDNLPVPIAGAHDIFVYEKAELATIARTVGARWRKYATDGFFSLRVEFDGGHSYDVNVSREQVCRKVVTGTRLEPAKPAQVVEEFHWVCDEPLLAEVAQ